MFISWTFYVFMFFHDLSVDISSIYLCRGVFLFIFRNISVKVGFTLMLVIYFSYFVVTGSTEPSGLIVIS